MIRNIGILMLVLAAGFVAYSQRERIKSMLPGGKAPAPDLPDFPSGGNGTTSPPPGNDSSVPAPGDVSITPSQPLVPSDQGSGNNSGGNITEAVAVFGVGNTGCNCNGNCGCNNTAMDKLLNR